MTLSQIKTKTGKTIQDFQIPEGLLKDVELVTLIMQSETMSDKDRQYWFNLSKIMTPQHTEKLRGILITERDKMAAIDAKYSSKKKIEDPAVLQKKAEEMAKRRREAHNEIKRREQELQVKKQAEEEAILKELESL